MRARLLAEALGTFALVFAGCGAMLVDGLTGGALGVVGVGIVFGLVVLAMIHALGDVSGAHLNPAVSFAFWRAGRLPARDTALYALAQCAGAILAATALRLLFGGGSSLGATIPSGAALQSFGLEFVLSFLLMLVSPGSCAWMYYPQPGAPRTMAADRPRSSVWIEQVFPKFRSGSSNAGRRWREPSGSAYAL